MKDSLNSLKERIEYCRNDFNLIKSRCKHAWLDGNFKHGTQCVHPYPLASSSRPKLCTIENCVVLNEIAGY